MGFEDLMANPTVMDGNAVVKEAIDLDKEFNDPLQACTITLTFASF